MDDADRRRLFDEYRVFLADGGYLNDVEAVRDLFRGLPDHLKPILHFSHGVWSI